MAHQGDCLFCKILKKEIPAEKVFENEHVFAFKDIQPQAEQHYLIIPKFHVSSLAELKKEQLSVMQEIFSAVLEIADQKGLRQKGFRTVINTGKEGGQTVFHMHVHMLSGSHISPRFG